MSYLLDYNPGTQQWGYPRRGGVQLSGTIIVHTAECARDDIGEDTSAEVCANFIANRADYGSYHRLVDSDSIIDMLPWEYEAWQDSETNNWAVGISAAVATTDWLTMPADRAEKVYRNLALCAADFVQYMATKGIAVPLTRITGAQARARVPGFCAHGDSGIARTDPGAAFDWTKFFAYTAQALTGSLSYASESITLLEAGFLMALSDQDQIEVRDNLRKLVEAADAEKAFSAGVNEKVDELVGNARKTFWNTEESKAILANTPAPELAAQIDAAGLAASVRDELIKLLEAGK